MTLGHDISKTQRTQDIQVTENVDFDRLLLKPYILQGLKECGFKVPSPIQYHGIPLGKCGFDLLLEAKSGTGKTAVFTIIALQQFSAEKGLQTIILAPTREIAAQISDVIKQIGAKCAGLKVEVVMGGLPIQDDINNLQEGVHILVGSPGRLKHLIKDGHIDTSAVRLLVLDEADKLMEKSFKADVNYIFSVLPKQKQVIMCSATYPEASKSFIEEYVPKAQHIRPNTSSILVGIKQMLTVVEYNTNVITQTKIKFQELLKILTEKQFKQCLIYCNYQARVKDLHKMLIREKWPAELLYGQQDQVLRLDALKTLQEYRCRILVSTDLAARGLDASNLDLVINFETPSDWPTYLHRIGRAGRFGQLGYAINIVSKGKEQEKFMKIIGSMKESMDINDLWSDHEPSFNGLSENVTIRDESNFNDFKENNEANDKATNSSLASNSDHSTTEIERLNNLHSTFQEIFASKQCIDEPDNGSSGLQSFDSLCSSFEAFNSSNNKENPSVENCEYKHITMTHIPIKKYLSKIQNNERDVLDSSDNIFISPKVSTEDIANYNKHNNLEKSTLIIKSSEASSKVSSEHVTNASNEKVIESDNGPQEYWNTTQALLDAGLPVSFQSAKDKRFVEYKQEHQNTEESCDNVGPAQNKELQNEPWNTTQALIDAGFPTSFQSVKSKRIPSESGCSNINNKWANQTYKQKVKVPYNNYCKQSGQKKGKSKNKIISHDETAAEPPCNHCSNKYDSTDYYNCDEYEGQEYKNATDNTHMYQAENNHYKTKKRNPNLAVKHVDYDDCGYNTQSNEHIDDEYAERTTSEDSCRFINKYYYDKIDNSKMTCAGYINWYSEFKMRMKQIELALYIDELTKLS